MSFLTNLFKRGQLPPKVTIMSNEEGLMETERPLAAIPAAQRENYFRQLPANLLQTGKQYTAVIRTERGDMTVNLFADKAPITVNNFVYLALQGYYDDTTCHRVIKNFMVQAGDPAGTGRGGPGYKFGDEFHPSLRFDRKGLLAMANAGPGTNGSQFFITHVPTDWLNNKHTIFGEVTAGEDVLFALRERDPGRDPRPGDKIVRIDIYEK